MRDGKRGLSESLQPDPRRAECLGQGLRRPVPGRFVKVGKGLVPAPWLNAGDIVGGASTPAGEVGPAAARPAGAVAMAVLFGSGCPAAGVPGEIQPGIGGGNPAAGFTDGFGVLEAILAERRELDHEVHQISRPGCRPAAFFSFLHEHRFVI